MNLLSGKSYLLWGKRNLVSFIYHQLGRCRIYIKSTLFQMQKRVFTFFNTDYSFIRVSKEDQSNGYQKLQYPDYSRYLNKLFLPTLLFKESFPTEVKTSGTFNCFQKM